jgi:hypothetical protein
MENLIPTLEITVRLGNISYLPIISSESSTSHNNNNNTELMSSSSDPYEFTFKNAFLVLFLISLSVVIILGNTIVLLAIFVDFRLRQPTHYLMGSLALADLLLGMQVDFFNSLPVVDLTYIIIILF